MIMDIGSNSQDLSHRYTYVANNPVNWIDPIGLSKWEKFKFNFQYSLSVNNQFFFGGIGQLFRTAFGIIIGNAFFKATGLPTLTMIVKDYLWSMRAYAPYLGMMGPAVIADLAASFTAHAITKTAVIAISFEAGIIAGSFIDALIQTFILGN
jgi:hypothetical protein